MSDYGLPRRVVLAASIEAHRGFLKQPISPPKLPDAPRVN